MSWRIIRSTPQYQVGAAKQFQVLRAASGPRGAAAGQDVGWSLSFAIGAGEVANLPPLPHAATYTSLYAHSDSGFAASQTLTIRQKRAGAVITTATLAVGPGANDWSATIAALEGEVADVFALVLPSPADIQCTDLSVSLGSTP